MSAHKNENATIVSFTSEFGDAYAQWTGEEPWKGEEPLIGATYNVEIDIDEDLIWDVNIFASSKNRCSIQVDSDGKIKFTGCLESLEDDGYAILRMGDYIIAFMADSLPNDTVGNYIILNAKQIMVFPFSYK